MDYRCEQGFDSPVCTLYGHNMKDGSMFAPLARYSDPAFMRNNHMLTVTEPDGRRLTYRIYSIRRTDEHDAAYNLKEPADDSRRILILSTCTGADGSERLLVYAEIN